MARFCMLTGVFRKTFQFFELYDCLSNEIIMRVINEGLDGIYIYAINGFIF